MKMALFLGLLLVAAVSTAAPPEFWPNWCNPGLPGWGCPR